MKKPILDALNERVLLADGGMAMELYSRGFFVNRCYEELNLSNAKVIQEIHQAYASAGAEIFRTNTFGANRIQLGAHGFLDKMDEINRAGVRLAKKAAGDAGYTAGVIGPIPVHRLPQDKAEAQD
ncbi:MAG: homocysteine S-methyltransferase family protein, partial [Candidatus Hinthialibacter sp.]